MNNNSLDKTNENTSNDPQNLLDNSHDSSILNPGEDLFDYDNPYNRYSIDGSDNRRAPYTNGQWLYDDFYRNNHELAANNPKTEFDRYNLN